MEMVKCSILNPLASSFVPSNGSGAISSEAAVFATEQKPITKETIRAVASYYVQKIIEVKREKGELALTKSEMVNLIQKLICLQYNISNRYDMLCIRSYLTERIPEAVLLDLASDDEFSTRANQTYRLPDRTFLIVSFYGLYRHEQAFRPMLSLSHRPESLKDKVWSLTDKDLKLWNKSVVRPCSCPPMFGYTIPSGFFGNPFNLNNLCPMNNIHMTCAEDSEHGNEYIMQPDFGVYQTSEDYYLQLEDPIGSKSDEGYNSGRLEVTLAKSDIRYYSDQLESIVSSVYTMIDKFETGAENEDLVDEGYGSCETFSESLWNPDISETGMANRIEEDNNNHPLLDVAAPEIEDVSVEVQEMIRKSLSSESDITPNCNPPCSAWCSKRERSQSLQSPTKPDTVGLLSETSELITDISSDCDQYVRPTHSSYRPGYRRSLSADDCNRINMMETSFSQTRRLPSHFKTKSLGECWKDNDSGVGTQWSSQEDVFEESEGPRDRAPMWNFFSGEDSLWQPLQLSEQSTLASHKRVRDLKRQTSSLVN